jgi:LEA14-like dessication related protein
VKNLVLGILVLILFVACRKPQGFDYRDVKNVKIEKLGFDKSTVSMELVYFNPNGFGVDLKRVDCDVYINNNYLGKYVLDTTMHIGRKAEFSLPSKMNVDMREIYKNALNLLFSNEVLVDIKGTTRVGKAGFFITVPFHYEGRHKLDLFN